MPERMHASRLKDRPWVRPGLGLTKPLMNAARRLCLPQPPADSLRYLSNRGQFSAAEFLRGPRRAT